MNTKQVSARCLWMLLLPLLAACSAVPGQAANDAARTQIVATFMAQITQTAAAASPTDVDPTETESPEETETPFLTPTPDPYHSLLERFRMISVSQGNLFVRDGSGLPVQITKSGKDHDPLISADGKKIVFYRGESFDDVFVINANGSDEKEIVNKTLLPELNKGMVKFLTFRPGTYDLLFSSYFCDHSVCGANIFLVSAGSAKITKLVSGLSTPASQDPNFALSPDGQYMSVTAPMHIDLYNLDGKPVHPNIINVSVGKNSMPLQFWRPDSSVLFALAEMQGTYVIWRYTLSANRAEQLPFAPPLTSPNAPCSYSVSPDRNWIFYQESAKEYDLGSLKDAQTKVYAWDGGCAVQWSANSQYFASQTAIGAVDGTPSIRLDGYFIAWLDASHYFFSKGKGILDLQTYIAEVGKEAAAVPENFIWSPVYAVLESTSAP